MWESKYFQVYNLGLPLGPIVKGVSFILLIILSFMNKPYDKIKISKIRYAINETQNVKKKYVIIYVIFSILMLLALIYLTILGQSQN